MVIKSPSTRALTSTYPANSLIPEGANTEAISRGFKVGARTRRWLYDRSHERVITTASTFRKSQRRGEGKMFVATQVERVQSIGRMPMKR